MIEHNNWRITTKFIGDRYTVLDDGFCTPLERIESMVKVADEARQMSREELLK